MVVPALLEWSGPEQSDEALGQESKRLHSPRCEVEPISVVLDGDPHEVSADKEGEIAREKRVVDSGALLKLGAPHSTRFLMEPVQDSNENVDIGTEERLFRGHAGLEAAPERFFEFGQSLPHCYGP